MTEDLQAGVVARLPGAAAHGLVPPRGAELVPGAALRDAVWTAERMAALRRTYRTDDRRVLATLWWYSVSAVVPAPALAGLVVGRPLSARAEDLVLALLPSGVPIAAVSLAAGGNPADDLRTTLDEAIGVVAAAGGTRPRPLWAIASDALAGRLLDLGRAVGEVPTATALASRLADAVGPPLPVPRYVDVAGARFVRRVSCCLIYRAPGQQMCTTCPRNTSSPCRATPRPGAVPRSR